MALIAMKVVPPAAHDDIVGAPCGLFPRRGLAAMIGAVAEEHIYE